MGRDSCEPDGWKRSPGIFAGVLAIALWGIVLLLNWLGSAEIPIGEEQFQQLRDQDLLAQIRVGPDGVHAWLMEPVQIESGGGRYLAEEVFLPRIDGVDRTEIENWRSQGIEVSVVGAKEGGWQGMGGFVLVASLLGIGVWHLWSQIQKDRRGIGSPRRRLKKLDEELKAGKISPDEYRQSAEAIWAEM